MAMKKSLGLPVLLLLLAAAGVGGWYWWTELRFLETTDNAYVEGDLSVISPRIAGYVAGIEAVENRPVRHGEVLLRLDDRDLRARVDEAAAALRSREAAIATAQSQLKVQATRIREAEATLASAAAQANWTQSDFERYSRLAERRNASEQTLGQARVDADRARAAVAAAEASLEAARDQIAVIDAARATAEAERAMAQAALELARIDLEHATLRAPIDGVIGNKRVQVGDYLKVGQQLMTIVPLDELYVEANFKETQLAGMRVGDEVRLEVDAYPETPLTGTIESLAPASGSTFSLLPPENATGNFTKVVQRVPVRIRLPLTNPLTGLLRPGLSVVVTADRRQGRHDVATAPIERAEAAPVR
jgi:membrane fusion protein (multidrug efflux system)